MSLRTAAINATILADYPYKLTTPARARRHQLGDRYVGPSRTTPRDAVIAFAVQRLALYPWPEEVKTAVVAAVIYGECPLLDEDDE